MLTLEVKAKVKLQNQLHKLLPLLLRQTLALGRSPRTESPLSSDPFLMYTFPRSISGGIQLSVEQLDHQERKNRVA